MTRAEWHGRADFAEYAEAVGVATEEIMAVMAPAGGPALVLYSVGTDEDAAVRRAVLRRDEDAVLRLVGVEQVGTLAGFTANIEKLMVEYREEEQ